jgi:hypothetical protein
MPEANIFGPVCQEQAESAVAPTGIEEKAI